MPVEMRQVDEYTWVVTDPRFIQQGRLERRKPLPWWWHLLDAYLHPWRRWG